MKKKLKSLVCLGFLSLVAFSAHANKLSTAQIKSIAVTFQEAIELKAGVSGKGTYDSGKKEYKYIIKKIGSGGFGDVLNIDLTSGSDEGSLVAKLIRPKAGKKPEVTPDIKQAIENLSTFQKNEHFLKYYGLITDKSGQVAILIERGGFDLTTYYKLDPVLRPLPLPELFHQITDGVQFMHELGYGHFDLKPANMLIGLDGKLKIIDTDGAIMVTKSKVSPVPTSSPGYSAPEVFNHAYKGFFGSKEIDWRESDIWSLGMTFLSLKEKMQATDILADLFPAVKEAKMKWEKNKNQTTVKVYRDAMKKTIAEGKVPNALQKSMLNDKSAIFKLIVKMLDTDPTKGHRPDIAEVKIELNKIFPQQRK